MNNAFFYNVYSFLLFSGISTRISMTQVKVKITYILIKCLGLSSFFLMVVIDGGFLSFILMIMVGGPSFFDVDGFF
jgi:hypothetical protein